MADTKSVIKDPKEEVFELDRLDLQVAEILFKMVAYMEDYPGFSLREAEDHNVRQMKAIKTISNMIREKGREESVAGKLEVLNGLLAFADSDMIDVEKIKDIIASIEKEQKEGK